MKASERFGRGLSRADALKAAAAGLTVALLPSTTLAASEPGLSFPFNPQVSGTYTPESPQQIVSNLLTIEYLEATGLDVALTQQATALGFTGLLLAIVQAAIANVQYQIDFLAGLIPGAAPITQTFTGRSYQNQQDFLTRHERVTSRHIATYTTAAREFAELGQPILAKYMVQGSGSWANLRGLMRAASALAGNTSAIPPNNKTFEQDLFLFTRDAVASTVQLGFINGPGPTTAYPGRAAILAAAGPIAAAVINQTPDNSW